MGPVLATNTPILHHTLAHTQKQVHNHAHHISTSIIIVDSKLKIPIYSHRHLLLIHTGTHFLFTQALTSPFTQGPFQHPSTRTHTRTQTHIHTVTHTATHSHTHTHTYTHTLVRVTFTRQRDMLLNKLNFVYLFTCLPNKTFKHSSLGKHVFFFSRI